MMPGLRLSLAMTANKAANETMQFPTNSSRTASHLHKHRIIGTISKTFRHTLPQCSKSRLHLLPVCYYTGVIGFLVMVYSQVTLMDKALLFAKGSDDGGAQQGFIEVGVDGRAADRLQSLQLAR